MKNIENMESVLGLVALSENELMNSCGGFDFGFSEVFDAGVRFGKAAYHFFAGK